MSTAKQAFWCTHRDGYSVIAFPKELSTADMSEVREVGVRVIDQLSVVKSPSCLVDLSALSYMGSSMVASIVKIWKTVNARGGKMVVVAPGEQIRDVLKVTGLTKVWTIVTTFESGVHALGCSTEAKVEKRERRLLTFVGAVALVGAGIAVAAKLAPSRIPLGVPPEWMILTLGGLALLASGISSFRERGWRMALSIVVLVMTIGTSSAYLWHTHLRVPVPEDGSVPADESAGEKKAATTSDRFSSEESNGSDSEATAPAAEEMRTLLAPEQSGLSGSPLNSTPPTPTAPPQSSNSDAAPSPGPAPAPDVVETPGGDDSSGTAPEPQDSKPQTDSVAPEPISVPPDSQ